MASLHDRVNGHADPMQQQQARPAPPPQQFAQPPPQGYPMVAPQPQQQLVSFNDQNNMAELQQMKLEMQFMGSVLQQAFSQGFSNSDNLMTNLFEQLGQEGIGCVGSTETITIEIEF